MLKNDPEYFTAEKSVYAIFRETFKLKASSSNSVVAIIATIVAILYVCCTSEDETGIISRAHDLAVLGITFSTTLLGFLIAGFTVFATFTNKEMFIRIAFLPDPNTDGLSYLKSFFFVFMNVFIHYVGYLFFSFAVYFFLGKNGIVSEIARSYFWNYDMLVLRLSKLSIVIFMGWTFFLVMLLKSFVFNTYHVVMTTLRYEYEKQNGNL